MSISRSAKHPGAVGPIWVDPGKSRSLAVLTLLIALGLLSIRGLQALSTQKIAPYPMVLLGFSLLMLSLSVVLYFRPDQSTRMSVIGLLGFMVFLMSTIYRSLFGAAENPWLIMWYLGASHAYVLINQVVIFAIFERGATMLCGILHGFICALLAIHLVSHWESIPPVTFSPMFTLFLGPLVSLYGLNFLVRWRNEAQLREQAIQQEKEKLMAMMSHEIRGQLQTTLSTSELLTTKISDPLGKRALNRLSRVTLQLDRYLRDWVEFVRVENPELSIEIKRLNLVELVDQTLDEKRSAFIGKGLVLIGPMWSGLDPVELMRWETATGDAVRLKQVLSNVLDNALKYTEEGSVTVSVATVPDQAHWGRISVSDTGLGIEADHLKWMFEPFARVGRSGAPAVEGSGLGLAISSRLMKRMGGQLTATSEPGQGSCFTMSFPLRLKPYHLHA